MVMSASRPAPLRLVEGCFVIASEARDLGVGKLIRYGPVCTVEYLHSLSEDDIERREFPRARVRRVPIPANTRCLWLQHGEWRQGWVVWSLGDQYRIKLPDGRTTQLPERDLHVRERHDLPAPEVHLRNLLVDPIGAYRTRSAWLSERLTQEQANAGLDGALSAPIHLHRHQLRVVARVLSDPVQRYLLADEVGLGKTVEAGMIVRQYLVDNPSGRVVIVVPDTLCIQWRDELEEKFLVNDFGDAQVEIISMGRPKALTGLRDIGLVVVDEVHRIAAQSRQAAFKAVQELAHRAPRLLLLSATPILHNEEAFLAMLHLLDPAIYRLEDLERFKWRLEQRTELGLIFYTFTAQQPDFHLRRQAEHLRAMFSEDGELTQMLSTLERFSVRLGPMAQQSVPARSAPFASTWPRSTASTTACCARAGPKRTRRRASCAGARIPANCSTLTKSALLLRARSTHGGTRC